MSDEPRTVDPEVVEKLPEEQKSFFHPASGGVILALDWLAFGSDVVSGFLALAVSSLVVFAVTFFAVEAIQVQWHGDAPGKARLKALIGACAAAVPFPIGGTLLGGAILAMSGLNNLRRK